MKANAKTTSRCTMSLALWNQAASFEESAKTLHRLGTDGIEFSYSYRDPVLFLYYRSIELALKAHLLASGLTDRELRSRKQFGHSIRKLFEASLQRGIPIKPPIDADDERVCGDWAAYYEEKQYEYPDGSWTDCPPLDKLARTCRKIVSASEAVAFDDGRRVSDENLGKADEISAQRGSRTKGESALQDDNSTDSATNPNQKLSP